MELQLNAMDKNLEIAKPIHIQRLEASLDISQFFQYAKQIMTKSLSDSEIESDSDTQESNDIMVHGDKMIHGVVTTKEERRSDKLRLYNFSNVGPERRWLQEALISDSHSSDTDIEDKEFTHNYLQQMLKIQIRKKKVQANHKSKINSLKYQYYSTGLLSNHDRFLEHKKTMVRVKKKRKTERKPKKINNKETKMYIGHDENELDYPSSIDLHQTSSNKDINEEKEYMDYTSPTFGVKASARARKKALLAKTPEVMAARRRKVWQLMSKKELGKVQRAKVNNHKEYLTTCKRIATVCMKIYRQKAMASQKIMKENVWRAKRLTREMQAYWKRYDRVERETKRRMEREAEEQRKMDVELIEAKRQQRKLNFLITQTELYAHFMSKKLGKASPEEQLRILSQLDEEMNPRLAAIDDYDCELMKQRAKKNASDAFLTEQARTKRFDATACSGLSTPLDPTIEDQPQPSIFRGNLKGYQLKGMTWLANLYDQGISGILADEMGLGKTVQSIAFLCHVAERYGVWGPFLIISPASTLHNWQQEMARFVPDFNVVPYWGSPSERKILRQFWDQKDLHTKDASFHVVITSYQLVISDYKYFNRIKWQYMILDEAQAIKSTSSVRWKLLLGFNCRNRLLLSGTPIQNSMAELWALLHFIMPTLFDSHDEFNEWFSKDIESHAENKTGIDEKHLSRLHMILKPFMLRRIKKDVENELSDKIEIMVYCPLTTRQKLLYIALRQKIQIEDLLHYTIGGGDSAHSVDKNFTSNLMNLVMQFRKVCNHPELFERRDARSPYAMKAEDYSLPVLIFNDGILQRSFPSKNHLLYNRFNIFTTYNIHRSLNDGLNIPKGKSNEHEENIVQNDTFSFSRFMDLSPQEMFDICLNGIISYFRHVVEHRRKEILNIHRNSWWNDKSIKESELHNNKLMLNLYLGNLLNPYYNKHNMVLKPLVFTAHVTGDSTVYSHTSHTYHCMTETMEHRIIRSKNSLWSSSSSYPLPTSKDKKNSPNNYPLLHEFIHKEREPRISECEPTELPTFIYGLSPKIQTLSRGLYCSNRSAQWCKIRHEQCENISGLMLLNTGAFFHSENELESTRGGLEAARPSHGWSNIIVPDKQTLVSDAGKLAVLDSLLTRLKSEGHRVLIYSQMTKMIDLLEEYMWHRKHKYMRLDGSSKISARRDMVADFQARADIFVFLLSTRAGGLGINLTAADTVIFYDSDWNPTVDQQAMDRAHRLGQTKQVTVYRLICKGTIEERILQRAREKSEIQRMVISGGNFKPDTLKPKEVVSLLLDDDELEMKYRQKTVEESDILNRKRKLPAPLKVNNGAEVKQVRSSSPDWSECFPGLDSAPGSPRSDRSCGPTLISSASSSLYGGERGESFPEGDNIVVDADEAARDESTFAGYSLGFNTRRRHHPRGTKRGRPRGSRRGGGNGAPGRPLPEPATASSGTGDGAIMEPPAIPSSSMMNSGSPSNSFRRGPGRPRLKLSGPSHRGIRRARRPHGPMPVPLGPRPLTQ